MKLDFLENPKRLIQLLIHTKRACSLMISYSVFSIFSEVGR